MRGFVGEGGGCEFRRARIGRLGSAHVKRDGGLGRDLDAERERERKRERERERETRRDVAQPSFN